MTTISANDAVEIGLKIQSMSEGMWSAKDEAVAAWELAVMAGDKEMQEQAIALRRALDDLDTLCHRTSFLLKLHRNGGKKRPSRYDD